MATELEFKVGDRVRLTGRSWENHRGSIVIVEGVDSDGDAYFHNDEGYRLFIIGNSYGAELTTESTRTPYKIGDKVRLTGSGWDDWEFRDSDIVTVDKIRVDGARAHGWKLELDDAKWETELVEDETSSKLATEEITYELETLITDIGLTNEANGFNRTTEEARDPDYLSNKLLLMVSEIIEAQDEIRNGYDVDFTYYTKDGKPEGFVSEIADVFIRVLGTVHELGVTEQFLKMVPEKLEYNKGRGFRHGKKF